MLKQSLAQKQLQKLSPQQIQLMKLLQVPTVALEQRIKEELEANPALEEGSELNDDPLEAPQQDIDSSETPSEYEDSEEFEADPNDNLNDYLDEILADEDSSYNYESRFNSTGEDNQKTIPIPLEYTFQEHLERQLGMIDFDSEIHFLIAKQIIGSIDEDGYLRREPIAIVDDLAFTQNVIVSEDQVLDILAKIQQFDPPGIAARSLQECLILQINARLNKHGDLIADDQRPLYHKARLLLQDHFPHFIKKHYHKLTTLLGTDDEGLKEIIDIILKLNPKPAGAFVTGSRSMTHYIVPDFIVENKDGELDLILNSRNAPELHVSDAYKEMLKAYKDNTGKQNDAYVFVKNKVDAAKWFIDAIKQRQNTMYRTMYALLQLQKEYFVTGDPKKIRPMILKDIADMTGLDISTVSRVANSKYVQSEFGTKLLKEFFNEAMQTESGEEVSTIEVKQFLSEIIGKEDKRKPLSDDALKDLLHEKGYQIARRTVAKYREQLNIPVARLRKEL